MKLILKPKKFQIQINLERANRKVKRIEYQHFQIGDVQLTDWGCLSFDSLVNYRYQINF
ncbi:hypothetical protein SHAb15599_00002 [Acinetobacter phage SH-Ab 15599]|nr:hypothetical protein SHAb15599_00002 [Acinetobacter phage SH-Ab 15599]